VHGSDQICAVAGVGVINVAIWVLLCIMLMFPVFGFCMTTCYGLVLVAVIRRAEKVPQNRALVDFLYAGIPVVVFVAGLHLTRLIITLAGEDISVRLELSIVGVLAGAPSFVASVQLLLKRKGGPLVVNVTFGLWLLLLIFRSAARPIETLSVFDVLAQVKQVADFAAYIAAVEGLVGTMTSVALHRSGHLPEVVTWLQGVSSLLLLAAGHFILQLPAWSSTGDDVVRWSLYAVLCRMLLAGGSTTGRLTPGVCAATGFFFLLLRLAFGATDIARFALNLTWEENLVSLVSVFSTALAATGFAILHCIQYRAAAARNWTHF